MQGPYKLRYSAQTIIVQLLYHEFRHFRIVKARHGEVCIGHYAYHNGNMTKIRM